MRSRQVVRMSGGNAWKRGNRRGVTWATGQNSSWARSRSGSRRRSRNIIEHRVAEIGETGQQGTVVGGSSCICGGTTAATTATSQQLRQIRPPVEGGEQTAGTTGTAAGWRRGQANGGAIVDDGHSHVRMRLDAEAEDGDDDEEDWYDGHTLYKIQKETTKVVISANC